MNDRRTLLLLTAFYLLVFGCSQSSQKGDQNADSSTPSTTNNQTAPFPDELVNFKPFAENPIFTGTQSDTWDQNIRERGYILKEGEIYHMWYTGHTKWDLLSLGYATSNDGINWERYSDKPIFDESWTEDMMVLKVDSIYYMFAEGKGDIAHYLTSTDRINWKDHGSLDIRKVDGSPISKGPYGTPTAWFEDNTWYLFYERGDLGIWLATSSDLKQWTNVQDDPVIAMGPEPYDRYGLAVNQIYKYDGWYYAYYHGTGFEDWHEWSTSVAASKDLIHWTKYLGNPIMEENKSSGIIVKEADHFRLYTMHNQVALHFSGVDH